MRSMSLRKLLALVFAASLGAAATTALAEPRVVLISLDGAMPSLVEDYLQTGVLPDHIGLGRLRSRGVSARQNITATPSVTAVSHIAIATGSTAVHAAGVSRSGEPLSNVIVVSDHGMAPFHTAVSLSNVLASAGINTALLGIRTTGPAANIYVNLSGREPGGVVAPADYQALVDNIATVLRNAADPNLHYNLTAARLFTHVWSRPSGCGQPGFCVDDNIGQDSGDVMALMAEGYNFDGTQSPVVRRLGDDSSVTSVVYSVPNFYGAHGHDSNLRSMSAIMYAAGPNLRHGRRLSRIRNIDIAPTVMEMLGVEPADTVDGRVIPNIFR